MLDAWDETASLRGVAIDLGTGAAHHRTPGQVVKLRVGGAEGYFALSTAPTEPAELLVARGSALGDAVIAAAQPGARLGATEPFGPGFPLEEAHGRDLLVLATGSGIAPIRAVLRHVRRNRDAFGRVAGYYGAKTPGDHAYAREVEAELTLVCSRAPAAFVGARGYVQDVAVQRQLGGLRPEATVAFLCGARAMVADARAKLATRGLPADRTFLNF